MKRVLTLKKFVEEYNIPMSLQTFRNWVVANLDKFPRGIIFVKENNKRNTYRVLDPEKLKDIFEKGF